MKPQFAIVTMTPKRCAEAIETTDGNRRVNWRTVDKYATDMAANRWKLNGAPILFDEDGALLDGQHRCHASIKARVSFKTVVGTSIKRDAFDTIDQGKARTIGDVLTIQGIANANHMGALARRVLLAEQGKQWYQKGGTPVTVQQLEDIVKNRSERLQWAIRCTHASNTLVPASIASFVAYHGYDIDQDFTTAFFELLATGENLSAHDPILHLRNRMIWNKATRKSKFTIRETAALLIKTFNAALIGKPVRTLKFGSTEPFPEVGSVEAK